MTNRIFTSLNVLMLIVCFALLFMLYVTINFPSSELQQPFQFDDPNASYKIERMDSGKNYVVAVYYNNNTRYPLTYSYVGNSHVDLSPYVGHEVHVVGKWPRYIADIPNNRNTQCIAARCHKILDDHKYKVTVGNIIDIYHIEFAEHDTNANR